MVGSTNDVLRINVDWSNYLLNTNLYNVTKDYKQLLLEELKRDENYDAGLELK